jgi:hypothetical protein
MWMDLRLIVGCLSTKGQAGSFTEQSTHAWRGTYPDVGSFVRLVVFELKAGRYGAKSDLSCPRAQRVYIAPPHFFDAFAPDCVSKAHACALSVDSI